MATLKTKFSVGLFLIIGMAVAIVAIIWLGMSNYLEKGRFYVAYFDESVQGLDKDSPVKYRGVHIGRVFHIGVAPDDRLIEVVLKIESDIQPQHEHKNIVAQLKSVGITGLMFIELEHKKPGETDLSPSISFKPPYPVIPTRPSEISKIFKGIEDVFNLFRALDTATISEQLVQALKKVNQTIDDAQLSALVADVRSTVKGLQSLLNTEKMNLMLHSVEKTSSSIDHMAVNADAGISEIRQAVSKLDRVISSSGGNVQQMTADLKISAQQVKRATESATALLQNTDRQVDAIHRQLLATLNRIDRASDTLTRLLERLENQPSQLIFSRPAPDKP